MKILNILAIAFSLIIITGCQRYENIDHTKYPSNINNKELAKRIIERTVAEQPNKPVPLDLIVNDECIKFSNDKRNLVSYGSLRVGSTIYFTSPTKLELYRHKSSDTGHVILWRGNKQIFRVSCYSVDDAKRFINAFKFMKQYNLDKENQLASQSKN